jgi:hypothetical protein
MFLAQMTHPSRPSGAFQDLWQIQSKCMYGRFDQHDPFAPSRQYALGIILPGTLINRSIEQPVNQHVQKRSRGNDGRQCCE